MTKSKPNAAKDVFGYSPNSKRGYAPSQPQAKLTPPKDPGPAGKASPVATETPAARD